MAYIFIYVFGATPPHPSGAGTTTGWFRCSNQYRYGPVSVIWDNLVSGTCFWIFFGPNKVLPTAWLETRHTTKKYDFDCCYCMHVPKPIHSRPHSFKRPVWSSEAKSLEELLNDNSRPVVSWLLWLALTGLIYGVRHASFRIYKGSTCLPTPIQCWFVWHEFFYLLTSGME